MSPAPPQRPGEPEEGGAGEPPPVLKSWRNLYVLVALGLAAEILFCAWLSRLGR